MYIQVKWCRYRPGVAQRVSRGIALLFHDRDTRRGWVVSSTPRPHLTPWKDPVPILQDAGWAPGPVWTGRKSRPHWDSILDCPVISQSLYRLSYPAHICICIHICIYEHIRVNIHTFHLYVTKESTCFDYDLCCDVRLKEFEKMTRSYVPDGSNLRPPVNHSFLSI